MKSISFVLPSLILFLAADPVNAAGAAVTTPATAIPASASAIVNKTAATAGVNKSASGASVDTSKTSASPVPRINAPDLDLTIRYYNKTATPDGVTREARYEEKMLRRADHVWVARVLPASAPVHAHNASTGASTATSSKGAIKPASAAVHQSGEHAQFNYAVLPRHVVNENGKIRIEFIDPAQKIVVQVPPPEYDNVSFDGSWDNANFLLDPKLLKNLPLSNRTSTVPGARWRELEQNGVFQRVLWDEQKQIPLLIEIGDKAQTHFRRVEIKPEANLTRTLPWQNLKGFAQKEYSDFLD